MLSNLLAFELWDAGRKSSGLVAEAWLLPVLMWRFLLVAEETSGRLARGLPRKLCFWSCGDAVVMGRADFLVWPIVLLDFLSGLCSWVFCDAAMLFRVGWGSALLSRFEAWFFEPEPSFEDLKEFFTPGELAGLPAAFIICTVEGRSLPMPSLKTGVMWL